MLYFTNSIHCRMRNKADQPMSLFLGARQPFHSVLFFIHLPQHFLLSEGCEVWPCALGGGPSGRPYTHRFCICTASPRYVSWCGAWGRCSGGKLLGSSKDKWGGLTEQEAQCSQLWHGVVLRCLSHSPTENNRTSVTGATLQLFFTPTPPPLWLSLATINPSQSLNNSLQRYSLTTNLPSRYSFALICFHY